MILEELAYRGGFIFDVVNENVPTKWESGFDGQKEIERIGQLRFVFQPRINYEDTFIVQEGKDLINLSFDKGYGRVNIVSVISEFDHSIKAIFPDQDTIPVASNLLTQGVTHRSFLARVKTEEEALSVAKAEWQVLGSHQELTIDTIGNPFIIVGGWITVLSTFFNTQSIYAVDEITHEFSNRGFTTKIKAVGYLYDGDGNLFQTPEEILEAKREYEYEQQQEAAEEEAKTAITAAQGQPKAGEEPE
jgi:hypothetical protein